VSNLTVAPSPFLTILDDNGDAVNAGLCWTYLAGTVVPQPTYTDSTGTVPNANPIVADAGGRFIAFLPPGSSYDFVFETAPILPDLHGGVIKTVQNVQSVPSAAGNTEVPGTAGEVLSPLYPVYLSDGSGGKVAGQFYVADATNPYSSTLPQVGMVPSQILAGASGTIRYAGQITGLTGLVVGTKYYIAVGGGLTATAPVNAREIGVADSPSSILLSVVRSVPIIDPSINGFRLTLTTAVPVTTADVLAATTIYCTPYKGNGIVLFDAAGIPTVYTSGEFSIAVPASTSQMYDVFCINNAGALALELLAWTNDTTRATALVRTTTGVLTKSGDLTRRYLGSCRTTAVNGQTEDSAVKRYQWNYYHRARRQVRRFDATSTWNYTTATIRQAHADAANQIDLVQGLAESLLDLTLAVWGYNSAGALYIGAGIGEDSTTTFSSNATGTPTWQVLAALATAQLPIVTRLVVIPAVGRHFYSHNEYSQANGTTTWTETDPLALGARGGLGGWWES
jgi:hypothetical protein